MTRLKAMWLECITASTSASALRAASSDPLFEGDAFPYVVLTAGLYAPGGFSQDFSMRPYLIQMAYVIGHVTEGYNGAMADRFYADEPMIITYFLARRKLQCVAHPTGLNDLDPVGCSFAQSQGFGVIPRSGIGVQCVGSVFNLIVPFNVTITQVY